MVFDLPVCLHDALGHSWTHINTGTQVLAKYKCITRKRDAVVSKFNPIPKAKFTERANVCSFPRDNSLGDPAIQMIDVMCSVRADISFVLKCKAPQSARGP